MKYVHLAMYIGFTALGVVWLFDPAHRQVGGVIVVGMGLAFLVGWIMERKKKG